MKYANKILIWLSLFLIPSIFILPGSALSFSDEDIFSWVVNQLKTEKDYPLPEIWIVSKGELQRIFRKSNEKSLKRWAGMYGEEAATEIMDQYLKEVIGLFDPKTNLIYVGSFLERCRQGSIVAHEFTHYLQVMENGTGDLESNMADALRFSQEIEASNIEYKFRETFCPSTANEQNLVPKDLFL